MTSARGRARAWAELLRISAVFTVPGDALAGAAATRTAPNRGTALAVGASVCLYEAGMALNDWADRDIDAVERPGRPLPSGRITPSAALTAASALTGAGLVCAALAGRRTLATATALAGTVWAYDLGLKNTPAGPYAMATARSLDLLLGATATHAPSTRQAVAPAALLGAHTLAVTGVSRHETTGGSSKAPLAALATAATIAWAATKAPTRLPATHGPGATNPVTAPPASVSPNHTTPGAAPTPRARAEAPTATRARRGPARAFARRGTVPAASRLPASGGGLPASRPPRWASSMARAVAARSPRPGVDATAGGGGSAATARPKPGRAGAFVRRATAPVTSSPSAPGGAVAARPVLRPATAATRARPGWTRAFARRGAALAASRLPASGGGLPASRSPRWASPMARAVAAMSPRPGVDATAVRPRPGPAGGFARRAVAPIASRPPAAPGGLAASRPVPRGLAVAAGRAASSGRGPAARPRRGVPLTPQPTHRLAVALAAAYLATAARPLAHAALNPSPYLLQRAVGGGIRAMIPLQAALVSRAGAGQVAVGLLLLMPVARRLSRKVSPT
ncbi:SCO3242 family prenyltransferase [Streptomyces sp. NPDC001700]